MMIPLKFKNINFKSKSVFCGTNFTFVIAFNKQKPNILLDSDEHEILLPLKEILLKKGSLAKFFGLIDSQMETEQA